MIMVLQVVILKEWLKGFSNTEGQASMILGAIIGGPFQAHSYYQKQYKKKQIYQNLQKKLLDIENLF